MDDPPWDEDIDSDLLLSQVEIPNCDESTVIIPEENSISGGVINHNSDQQLLSSLDTPSSSSSSSVTEVIDITGDLAEDLGSVPSPVPNQSDQVEAVNNILSSSDEEEIVRMPSTKPSTMKRRRKQINSSDSESDNGKKPESSPKRKKVQHPPRQLSLSPIPGPSKRKSRSATPEEESASSVANISDSEPDEDEEQSYEDEDQSYEDNDQSVEDEEQSEEEEDNSVLGRCARKIPEDRHIDPGLARIAATSTPKKKKTKKKTPRTRTPRPGSSKRRKRRNGSFDDDSNVSYEEDQEEEDSDGGTRGRTDVQYVSFHMINLKRFSGKAEEDVINIIISKYNSQKRNESKLYEAREDITVPDVKEDDERFFEGEKFQIQIYVQKVYKSIPLLMKYGVRDASPVTIHSVIFHFRPGEIFAVTTGQAFNVVHEFSDHEFPKQVAARLLSENGALKITTKQLIGNEQSKRKTLKQAQGANPRNILELCTEFEAELREKSSICRLSCFWKRGKDQNPWNGVRVKVGFTNIRFFKRFDVSDYLSIFEHLSTVVKGERTFQYDWNLIKPKETKDQEQDEDEDSQEEEVVPEEVEELDTDAHVRDLNPVARDIAKNLDLELTRRIQAYLASNRNPGRDINDVLGIENFDLCHKHVDDFSAAAEFTLTYDNGGRGYDRIKVIDHQPTFREILDYLNRCTAIEDNILKTTDKFSHILNKVGLGFKVKEVEHKSDKLFNYIEGNILYQDKVYWRAMTSWCSVNTEYLLTVHYQIIKLLEDQYLEVSPLTKPWPTPEDLDILGNGYPDAEKYYLSLYEEESNYWLPPNNETTQLFDMIQSEGTELKIYFVTSGLDYKTISKTGRIAKSALLIRNAAQKGGHHEKLLKNFHASMVEFSGSFEQKWPSFTKFMEKLSTATIVFAVAGAHIPNIPEEEDEDTENNAVPPPPSLLEERNLKLKMTESNIYKILAADPPEAGIMKTMCRVFNFPKYDDEADTLKRLAVQIQAHLVAGEYLKGETSSITSKLLLAARANFKLKIMSGIGKTDNRIEDFIFSKIVTKYQSRYKTFLSKLGLVKLGKDLEEVEWKNWKICEIPRGEVDEEEDDDEVATTSRKQKPSTSKNVKTKKLEKTKKKKVDKKTAKTKKNEP